MFDILFNLQIKLLCVWSFYEWRQFSVFRNQKMLKQTHA